MEIGGIWGGFYRISLWIMRLAYINILWGAFTILGAGIFGFMPASIGMFTVIRKWIAKDTEIPVFRTFIDSYKKEFIKANLFAIIILLIGYIFYVDLRYIGTITGSPFYPILLGALFLGGILYVMLVLYIVPVYVHYNLSFTQYIKYAILIGLTNLPYTIMMAVVLSGLYFIFMRIPGLIPFFSVSTSGFVIMWIANLAFMTLTNKKKIVETHEGKLP